MNTYLIPIADIDNDRVWIKSISARSLTECKEKIIKLFSDYSESEDYKEFVKDLNDSNFLIGEIKEIDEYT